MAISHATLHHCADGDVATKNIWTQLIEVNIFDFILKFYN
jgi:hypothetical protein